MVSTQKITSAKRMRSQSSLSTPAAPSPQVVAYLSLPTAMSKNLDPHAIIESMKAYSEDLRRKIVDAVRRGVPKSETASLFGVSLSSVKRFSRMDREGDSLAPKKPPGRPPKGTDATRRLLRGGPRRAPSGECPAKAALPGARDGRVHERLDAEAAREEAGS